MNLKSFVPLILLLPLTAVPGAQSNPMPNAGWQVAQAQVPPRPAPPVRQFSAPPIPGPTPVPTNAPAPAPAPAASLAAPASPSAPGMPSSTATPAVGTLPGAANPAANPAAKPLTNTKEPADKDYNFIAMPLEQVLDVYADLIGRTILRSSAGPSSVNKDTPITLKTQTPLTRTEAIQALEMVLGMNGITIVPIGDKFAKIVTEGVAGTQGGLISTNTTEVPEAGKMVTEIVQVKYTDLTDLTTVLKPFSRMQNSIIGLPSTQTLILRDYAENVDRMVEMVKKIDVLTPLIIKPRVIPIKYALASDIASALSALGASGGTSVGKSSSGANFSHSSGGTSTGGIGGGGIGGTGSTGGYPGSPMGTSSPLASAATSGRSSFQQNLNKIVSAAANSGAFQLFGQTKIIADERTNSLLVFANDEDMKMIMDIINKLDVVLQQVLIDAVIMEIDLNGNQSMGVSYAAQGSGHGVLPQDAAGLINPGANFLTGSSSSTNGASASTGSVSPPSGAGLANLPGGFSYFSKYGNDLNVVMQAVASDSRATILSRPRIQTSHAVPADMFIGKTVPYITSTYSYYGSGPSSQYSQLEIGIHLQVLPLINPDGLVVMDIQIDVEGIIGNSTINGSEVPITSKQQAGAKVAVRDGETVMLGGFIQDNPIVSHSGVPGLMSIPWLGNLFRSTTSSTSRQELVMLMRPTVLATPEIAASVATKERSKLAGIKQGERQIRLEEENRNAKIEADLQKDAEKRAEKAKKAADEAAKQHLPDGAVTNAPAVPSDLLP